MLTQKYFKIFANLLYNYKPYNPNSHITDEELLWKNMVTEIGDICQADNSNFDRGRFEYWCENGHS